MKRLIEIFCAVLLLLFCSSTVMAQSQKALDNRSVVEEEIWAGYNQPVICDGTIVDELVGIASLHAVYHFKDGEVIKRNVVMRGEATSLNPPYEVFRIKEHDLENWVEFWADGVMHWRFNLKGNMGSHYIGYYTLAFPGGVLTVEKILCK